MTALAISLNLALAAVRSEMQYRANFLLMVGVSMVIQLTGFAFIWVVLSRFQAIGGWSLGEIAFLYGLRLLVHALRGLCFGNVPNVQYLVREGHFDRILVRPLAPLLQVMVGYIYLRDVGNLIGGVGLFLAAHALVGIDWSPLALLYLVLAVIGGCLVEAAIALVCAALAFRLLGGHTLYVLVNDMNNTFGNYPLTIFHGAVQFVLLTVVPLAFVAYVPATMLLGRTDELSVSPLIGYGAPLVGGLFFGLTYLFWRHELGAYQSAGH
jgi:ABC-2 type transport system permease protein